MGCGTAVVLGGVGRMIAWARIAERVHGPLFDGETATRA